MKKTIITILFGLFPFCNGYSQVDNYGSAIDSLLVYFQTENAFSGKVTLQKYDQVIYSGDFNSIPNGTDRYKIGSVSKVVTAIVIHQLIDEGKITINTLIDQYFPSIKYADQITIGNLLSHTSGIYSVTDSKDFYSLRTNFFSRQDILDRINEEKPEFKPNSDASYSNSNYMLLGYIIEDVTGKTYPQNIKERISDKLNLPNTYCEISGAEHLPKEYSYKFNGETWNKDLDTDPSLPGAAGAIVSTSAELCKLMYHLSYEHLITDSSLATMRKLRSKRMGHGIMNAPFFEKEGWGHSGRIDEYRSFILHLPQDSIILAITTNGMNFKLNDIIIGVLSTYYGTTYNRPTFVKCGITNPGTEFFLGNYKAKLFGFIPVARFQITQAGQNFLYLSNGFNDKASEKSLLERRGEMVFYSPEAGGELTFKTNKKGKVKGIDMKQGNMTLKCKKVK